MKLATHYLSEIGGISIFPIISMLLFTVFFTFIMWHIIQTDKETVRYMEQLPFDESEKNN